MRSTTSAPVLFPELVFGLAGPIGTDMTSIGEILEGCLALVNYTSSTVKLTDEMQRISVSRMKKPKLDLASQYNWKMDYANAVRRKLGYADAMARVAISAIQRFREEETRSWEKPRTNHAYIIRQLKLPQEVNLLRQVYGKQFILISAFGSERDRANLLFDRLKERLPTNISETDARHLVQKLIDRDSNEDDDRYGQNLRDTFHLGDVIIDGIRRDAMGHTLSRFINALFGKTDISPTRDEMGMYFAKSASLQSADLSRQVGAAIFSRAGEILTSGCNEVPRAGGGNYWDQEVPDFRDIKKGYDPNDRIKTDILRNVIEKLREGSLLSKKALSLGTDLEIVVKLTGKQNSNSPSILKDSLVMDITEFGRVVHAEMNAICAAARTGTSIKETTLYCTTFPCHNCTKHIIAAGIKRVVFMEPYPKSRARELHEDELSFEDQVSDDRVTFVPFQGISPFRYRDIFQKNKRKAKDGRAKPWTSEIGVPMPLLETTFPANPRVGEAWALAPLLGSVRRA